MNRIQPSHVFWISLIAGVLIRAIIIFQPEDELLTRWGSDDLYYYSQIAGHVASGDGFTFDGFHSTNGFQPLFLFGLIPFGSWMLNDWHSSWIIVSLIVTIISALTCFQLRKWAREMGWSEWIAVILPAVFILHPKILSVTLNGTEGALSFLMLVLTLRAFLWMRDKLRIWQSIAVFSLFVITRMEFSLVLFFLAAFALIQGQSIKRWLLTAIGPIFTFSSWLVVNYIFFGNIIPSSGQAKALHAEWYNYSFFEGLKGAVGTIFYAESELSFVVIGLMLIGIYVVIQKRDKMLWGLLLTLGAVASILLILTIKSLHGFRDWYFVPQFLIMLIVVAHALEWFVHAKKIRLLLLPMILGMLWGEANWKPRQFNGQFVISACKDVKKIIPKDARIGSYNAGLPSACLGSDYTLVNLDGVVNNSVLKYLDKGTLEKYADVRDINYVFDNKASLLFFREHGRLLSSKVQVFYDRKNVWHLESVWGDSYVNPKLRRLFREGNGFGPPD